MFVFSAALSARKVAYRICHLVLNKMGFEIVCRQRRLGVKRRKCTGSQL